MDKQKWEYLKGLVIKPKPAPKLVIGHPGSVLDSLPKIVTSRIPRGKMGVRHCASNHERVTAGRRHEN